MVNQLQTMIMGDIQAITEHQWRKQIVFKTSAPTLERLVLVVRVVLFYV